VKVHSKQVPYKHVWMDGWTTTAQCWLKERGTTWGITKYSISSIHIHAQVYTNFRTSSLITMQYRSD